jgi:hypothetical protein
VLCQNSFTSAERVPLRSLGRFAAFADQAAGGLRALNLGGDVDGMAGFAQRRPLVQRLMRPVIVVVPYVLGQDIPEMPLAENQQVIRALTAKCSHEPLRE